jgi:hypothetical protein
MLKWQPQQASDLAQQLGMEEPSVLRFQITCR